MSLGAAFCPAALVSAILLLCGCSDSRSAFDAVRAPDTESRLHIAAVAADAGQTDIALSMYGAAAEAAPDNVDAQTRFANVLIRAGKPDLADKILTRALERKPDDPTLLLWLGNHRLETGATTQALQIFDKLLADKPREVAALNGRGIALDLMERHTDAQSNYRAALAIAGSDVASANNLAVSLMLDGHPAKAVSILLPLSQRADVPIRVRNNLVVAREAAGGRTIAEATAPNGTDRNELAALGTALAASSCPSCGTPIGQGGVP